MLVAYADDPGCSHTDCAIVAVEAHTVANWEHW